MVEWNMASFLLIFCQCYFQIIGRNGFLLRPPTLYFFHGFTFIELFIFFNPHLFFFGGELILQLEFNAIALLWLLPIFFGRSSLFIFDFESAMS